VEEISELIDKLKAEKKRINAKLIDEKVKFPVKDELVEQLDPQGKPCQPLPTAHINLSETLPAPYVNDAVGVWDFLNVFRYADISLCQHLYT
jgi:hypothetical protein